MLVGTRAPDQIPQHLCLFSAVIEVASGDYGDVTSELSRKANEVTQAIAPEKDDASQDVEEDDPSAAPLLRKVGIDQYIFYSIPILVCGRVRAFGVCVEPSSCATSYQV